MGATHVARRFCLVLAGLALVQGCGSEDGPPLEVEGCRIKSAKKLTPESTPLGFSAAGVIARAEVESLRLVYGYKPDSPEVDLEVGISGSDLDRVYLVQESHRQMGDLRTSCPQALTFPATITFRSPGGDFDERLQVDLFVLGEDTYSWRTCVPIWKLRGSYRPPVDPSYKPREVCIYGQVIDGEARGSFDHVAVHREDRGILTSFAGWWGVNPYAR